MEEMLLRTLDRYGILGVLVVLLGVVVWRAWPLLSSLHTNPGLGTHLKELTEGQREQTTLLRECSKRLEDIWREVRRV